MPIPLGLAGVAMMAVGALIAIGSLVLVLPPAFRVRRRAAALRASVEAGGLDVRSALTRLAASADERAALLEPWGKILRWSRHPLVAATIDWYARRRRAGA